MASVILGLIGKAGAGKDTVAARLVEKHGFTRVAFADPLKAAALEIDPIIHAGSFLDGTEDVFTVSLSEMVDDLGWDEAKARPEVRRLLQHLGSAMRTIQPDFWVEAGMRTVAAVEGPVVITDVRHVNEAQAVEFATGHDDWGRHAADHRADLVRVVRPGTGLEGAVAQHISETALDNYEVEYTLMNTSTIDALHRDVDILGREILG